MASKKTKKNQRGRQNRGRKGWVRDQERLRRNRDDDYAHEDPRLYNATPHETDISDFFYIAFLLLILTGTMCVPTEACRAFVGIMVVVMPTLVLVFMIRGIEVIFSRGADVAIGVTRWAIEECSRPRGDCIVCGSGHRLQGHHRGCKGIVCARCSVEWLRAMPGKQTWACCNEYRRADEMSREELNILKVYATKTHAKDRNLRLRPNEKRCPGCGFAICKVAGCNTMHCDSCGVGFCWRCLSRTVALVHHCVTRQVPPAFA